MIYLKYSRFCCLFVLFLFSIFTASSFADDKTIRIGVNLSFTGPIPGPVGDIKKGIDLAMNELKERGGVQIGGEKYDINLIVSDNKGDISTASLLTIQSCTKDRIIAMILPLFSDIAVQVASITNGYRVPAIAVNTTSPKITLNHKYAFRTSASYKDMAKTTLELANQEWTATKIAILYQKYNGYSTDMAKAISDEFQRVYGDQAVTAIETFRTGDTDFKAQLAAIIKSAPDFLYVPQYPNQVAEIVKQVRTMGWNKPVTGPDTWGTPELIKSCGELCKNLFYVDNFVSKGAEGAMRDFARKYEKQHGTAATPCIAFGYNTFNMLVNALERMKGITGNIVEDRKMLRNAIAATKEYDGVTGKISYKETGEPITCPIVVKINDMGKFVQHFTFCPQKK